MKAGCLFLIILVMIFVLISRTSNADITSTVVDANTEMPIEGAVVLVEWSRSAGFPGMISTKSYKVLEVLTNKSGKITLPEDISTPPPERPLPGVYYTWINAPRVTVYKQGYVTWNSKVIFPGFRERTDFKWGDGYVFRLDPFKPEYTHYAHTLFINSAEVFPLDMKKKSSLSKAIEWEEQKASQESRMRTPLKISGRVVDEETGEPIEGAVILVKGIWSDKPLELISDKEGRVTIEGNFHMIPRPPSVTVYKKGYVAWNSIWIFPNAPLHMREDFKWQDGYIFKLERWRPDRQSYYYNHESHVDFIRSGTQNSVMRESKLLKEAIEWEEKKAMEERDARNKRGMTK